MIINIEKYPLWLYIKTISEKMYEVITNGVKPLYIF